MSLQPVGKVEVVEVGGDDGDAVVVLTGGMALDGDKLTSSGLSFYLVVVGVDGLRVIRVLLPIRRVPLFILSV